MATSEAAAPHDLQASQAHHRAVSASERRRWLETVSGRDRAAVVVWLACSCGKGWCNRCSDVWWCGRVVSWRDLPIVDANLGGDVTL